MTKNNKMTPKKGDLRVWWIPQIPMKKSFKVRVNTLEEAAKILETLALYDLFQEKNKIKPDFSNTGGLQIWDPGCPDENGKCWVDWYNDKFSDFDEYLSSLEEKERS